MSALNEQPIDEHAEAFSAELAQHTFSPEEAAKAGLVLTTLAAQAEASGEQPTIEGANLALKEAGTGVALADPYEELVKELIGSQVFSRHASERRRLAYARQVIKADEVLSRARGDERTPQAKGVFHYEELLLRAWAHGRSRSA